MPVYLARNYFKEASEKNHVLMSSMWLHKLIHSEPLVINKSDLGEFAYRQPWLRAKANYEFLEKEGSKFEETFRQEISQYATDIPKKNRDAILKLIPPSDFKITSAKEVFIPKMFPIEESRLQLTENFLLPDLPLLDLEESLSPNTLGRPEDNSPCMNESDLFDMELDSDTDLPNFNSSTEILSSCQNKEMCSGKSAHEEELQPEECKAEQIQPNFDFKPVFEIDPEESMDSSTEFEEIKSELLIPEETLKYHVNSSEDLDITQTPSKAISDKKNSTVNLFNESPNSPKREETRESEVFVRKAVALNVMHKSNQLLNNNVRHSANARVINSTIQHLIYPSICKTQFKESSDEFNTNPLSLFLNVHKTNQR